MEQYKPYIDQHIQDNDVPIGAVCQYLSDITMRDYSAPYIALAIENESLEKQQFAIYTPPGRADIDTLSDVLAGAYPLEGENYLADAVSDLLMILKKTESIQPADTDHAAVLNEAILLQTELLDIYNYALLSVTAKAVMTSRAAG